jgi:hypothetical protein
MFSSYSPLASNNDRVHGQLLEIFSWQERRKLTSIGTSSIHGIAATQRCRSSGPDRWSIEHWRLSSDKASSLVLTMGVDILILVEHSPPVLNGLMAMIRMHLQCGWHESALHRP